MATIPFKPGPQVAGDIVIDSAGTQWKVLKNIANATAQPREGAYYTKVADAPVVQPSAPVLQIDLDSRDFKIVETELNGVITRTIRVIR